jgi:hypothetical protein
MASFEIRWRSSTKKDLRSLPREEVSRIIDAVAQLAEEPLPHGSQKLAGADHLIASASATIEWFMKFSGMLPPWRFSVCATEKMSTDNAYGVCRPQNPNKAMKLTHSSSSSQCLTSDLCLPRRSLGEGGTSDL